jgi:hypothetical protein
MITLANRASNRPKHSKVPRKELVFLPTPPPIEGPIEGGAGSKQETTIEERVNIENRICVE